MEKQNWPAEALFKLLPNRMPSSLQSEKSAIRKISVSVSANSNASIDFKMKLEPHIKIWLSTSAGEIVFGSGKCRLLQAIDQLGSLSAASESLNISYRKAWGDLKKAEEHIGKKLIIKNRGGSGGGRTSLTPEGAKLVNAYLTFVTEVKRQTAESYNKRIEEMIHETF